MDGIPLVRRHRFSHVVSTMELMNVDPQWYLARHGIPDWGACGTPKAVPLFHYVKAFEAGASATGIRLLECACSRSTG